jgi:dCMP deaminase
VGCVLVDSYGQIVATGYNGVASGLPHCNEPGREPDSYPDACEGASLPPSKSGNFCQSIHAEQNALIQCRHPEKVSVIYCTDAPCFTCTKMLLNLPNATKIVYSREYPSPLPPEAKNLWEKAGKIWRHEP